MRVVFKTPDATYHAINEQLDIESELLSNEVGNDPELLEERKSDRTQELNDFLSKWTNGEYITIEFDETNRTAKVLEVGR